MFCSIVSFSGTRKKTSTSLQILLVAIGFQITITALAVFTAGFTKGMKNPICFVAGTMVLTAMGLKAIETIQAGDQVISTNPDTFQTEEKKVVETYINKTTCIVKIIIQNEEIYTTMNHPFYVKGQGFVAAGKLSMGDEIMNASGGSYPVEGVELEERQEVVYNFQVEDYHTYYVGENSVLVHNDCPDDKAPTKGDVESIADFEKRISKLSPQERVAAVKEKARQVAEKNGLIKDSRATKMNGRDIYKDPKTGEYYSVDTQHGRFEYLNKKGKHLGEVDFNFSSTKPADSSGGHNINIK